MLLLSVQQVQVVNTPLPVDVKSLPGPDHIAIAALIVAAATLLVSLIGLIATYCISLKTYRATVRDYGLTFKQYREAQLERAKAPRLTVQFPHPYHETMVIYRNAKVEDGDQVQFKAGIAVLNSGTKTATDTSVRVQLPPGVKQIDSGLPTSAGIANSIVERHQQKRFFFTTHNFNDGYSEDTLMVGPVPPGDPVSVGTMDLLVEYDKDVELRYWVQCNEGTFPGTLFLQWADPKY